MADSKTLRLITRNPELSNLGNTIKSLIGEKLSKVEKLLAERLRSPYTPIAEMGMYIAESRGKRVRPIVLLLASRMLGYDGNDEDCTYAAIFEFIHTATLIHDDIVDQAILRRGRASLSSRWGAEMSVLMGDKVFLTAMNMAVKQGWSPLLPLISDTTLRLVKGELIQSHRKWDLTLNRSDNLEIIDYKTSCLFAACAETPGHLTLQSDETTRLLRNFGMNLGKTFQLIDDCLDFSSDEATLGKPAGNDLKEGKITLPLILYLERATHEERAFIEAVVASRRFDEPTLSEVAARVVESGAFDETRTIAHSYASQALELLSYFPANRFRSTLELIPDYILSRRF